MTGPEPLHLAVSVLLLLGPCVVYYQVVYVNSSDHFARFLLSLLHRPRRAATSAVVVLLQAPPRLFCAPNVALQNAPD